MGLPRFGQSSKGLRTYEEVNVAVGAGVAAGVAAEEDDLFGIEAFGDQFGYVLESWSCRF